MANKKLILILESGLKAKKIKTVEDEEMIKLLGRYLRDAEANLPKTTINTDDLDDDEQKKSDQKPSGSNPSQSSKAAGSRSEEEKKNEKKDVGESQKKGRKRGRQQSDGSEPHQALKIQTQTAQLSKPTSSITKPPQPSKLKHF